MDLVQHLRYFLTVADELHFGRAARRLFMAQPPLSQRIQRLEREYGAQLFDRSGGRVRLTVAGETLRAEAERIVAQVDRSLLLVRRAAIGAPGPLRVGVPPEIPGRVLAALSTQFAGAAPDTSLDLQEMTTVEQVRLLASGGLDVGLLRQPAEAAELRFGPPVGIPQGVVLARTSPLAQQAELTLVDLVGHDLILFPRSAAPESYDETLRICRGHGFDPARVHHARSPEFLVGMVAAGHGIAFDQGAVAQKEPRVEWRPLVGRPLVWRIAAAWPARAAHDAAPMFADVAERVLTREAATYPLAAVPPSVPRSEPRPWSVVFPIRDGLSA